MNKSDLTSKQIEIVKGLRKDLKMNRREFSDYTGIPVRTLEEWEAGRRTMPEYMLRMLAYYIYMQNGMPEKYRKENFEDE